MAKTIRRGVKVRYIGTRNPLMTGKVYEVQHKSYDHVEIYAPTRYLDGSIHASYCAMPIEDFELVK